MKTFADRYFLAICLLLIILLGIFFQYPYFNEFPVFEHSWAQTDRYAISLGFLNNGFNLFKPEVFLYNKLFPFDFQKIYDTTITSVDFPIHDFIAALLMKLLGSREVWIFKTYILFYSFAGLFFLGKIAYLLTKNKAKTLIIIVFAASSPTFVFYQNTFLPTIPSIANTIIGLYFYLLFLSNNKLKNFYIFLFFVTLATLSRTTCVIYLLSILCVESIFTFNKKQFIYRKLLAASLSICIVLTYFIFNYQLRSIHGSIFLSSLMPARSLSEAVVLLKTIKDIWLLSYFSLGQYILFIIFFSIAIILFIQLKNRKDKLHKPFITLTTIVTTASIIFSFLMLRQYSDHDYYFIDILYLPAILILIFSLSLIPVPTNKELSLVGISLASVILIFMIISAKNSQANRRNSSKKTQRIFTQYKNIIPVLDSLKISKNVKILIIDPFAPNLPFIIINRKGFALLSLKKSTIQTALSWPYDYLIYQNESFVSAVYNQYPEFISEVNPIYANTELTICKKNKIKTNTNLLTYLKLNDSKPEYEVTSNFEDIDTLQFSNVLTSDQKYFRGGKSYMLTEDKDFGLTYKSKTVPVLQKRKSFLLLNAKVLAENSTEIDIVVSINEGEKNIYYEAINLEKKIVKGNNWNDLTLSYNLPQVINKDYELAIFVWNAGKTKVNFDDLKIQIY